MDKSIQNFELKFDLEKRYKCELTTHMLNTNGVTQTTCGHRLCTTCLEEMREKHTSQGGPGILCCPGPEESCKTTNLNNEEHVLPDHSMMMEMGKLEATCRLCGKSMKWLVHKSHLKDCPGTSQPTIKLTNSSTQTQEDAFVGDLIGSNLKQNQYDFVLGNRMQNGGSMNGDTYGFDAHTAFNSLQNQFDTFGRRVIQLEQAQSKLEFQFREPTNYNGKLIWKVSDYSRRKAEAVSGAVCSIYSQPFYTDTYGYKMCVRMYLNGDGMGKGTHMSLFLVVMKGPYDAILQWPFRKKVTLQLMVQGDRSDGTTVTDTFRLDPTSSSFKKPVSNMNIPSGCPLFVCQRQLECPEYLKDDTIFVRVKVDPDCNEQ